MKHPNGGGQVSRNCWLHAHLVSSSLAPTTVALARRRWSASEGTRQLTPVAEVLLGRLERLGLLGPKASESQKSLIAQALVREGAVYADAEDLAPGGGAATGP